MEERTKKKVELPLCEPLCSTYNFLGYDTSVLHSNPSVRNWYMNEIFILRCTTKFLKGEYSSPQIHLLGSTHYANPYLEKIVYPMKYAKGYINSIIKELLNDGYYVCFLDIDDYYLEGKSWYKQRHIPHDGMIFGYDNERKIYNILSYDENWLFRPFEVSQRSFEKGRKSMFERGRYGKIIGLKPKNETVAFDAQKVVEKLSEYLTVSSAVSSQTGVEMTVGIAVHDVIAKYIEMHIDGSIPYEKLDRRVFRLIWEHKQMMLERLKITENALGLDSSVSEAYSALVADSDRMRMLYALHHAKRRDSVLPTIRNMLIKLRNTEEKLLFEFIEKAKGEKKNEAVELH